MDKEKHKPILSVRVNAELIEWIDDLCERTGIGRAEIVERCLYAGLVDERQLVSWLESPMKGPFVNMLLHPKVLRMLGLAPDEIDETQQQVRKNVREKKRSPKGRPAAE